MILTVVTLLLIALVAVITKALHTSEPIGFAQQGKRAHEFALPRLGTDRDASPGNTLALAALRGKPLIINFWASWCESCIEESRALEQFYQQYHDRVQLIGIAVQDTPEAASAAAASYGMTFPLALDDKGSVAIDYGVTGVPETFFVDSGGILRARVAGPVDFKDLSEHMDMLSVSKSR